MINLLKNFFKLVFITPPKKLGTLFKVAHSQTCLNENKSTKCFPFGSCCLENSESEFRYGKTYNDLVQQPAEM